MTKRERERANGDDAEGERRASTATATAAKERGRRRRAGNAFDETLERNDLFGAHGPRASESYRVDARLGLRFVVPYEFDFICGVKERWAGQRLCALFAEEFPMRPLEYYRRAHALGRLRVEENGRAAVTGSNVENVDGPILRGGNRVRHFIHRHEPPVLADEVEVLSVTDDVVSVNKPATLPVHPTGQYRLNTVMALLSATRKDLGRLFPIHRLDKNVSGLLLLARSAESANALRMKMESRQMRKEYVARVQGHFNTGNEGWVLCDEALGFDAKARVALWRGKPGTESMSERSEASFKGASTKFSLLNTFDDGTSLVKCEPFTGRSHQIRAHLAILGYPIANDVSYGGSLVEIERATLIQRACDTTVLDESNQLTQDEALSIDYTDPDRPSREANANLCPHCPRVVHAGDEAIDLEAIWLHCVRYSGDEWAFECPTPPWAEPSSS